MKTIFEIVEEYKNRNSKAEYSYIELSNGRQYRDVTNVRLGDWNEFDCKVDGKKKHVKTAVLISHYEMWIDE